MANLSSKQRNLFEALHNSRAEDFKTFNKKSYRGVWSSIIDKYPESAHFVYELLQNADDAEATEVYIVLQRDRMLFKHNGKKHFDITREDAEKVGDINSITGIGDSSKVDTQNKIGKFGVGFKAVFQYTDTPEIYDDYFKFKIENYIIPTLLPYDHPNRKEGETLFVFPFKDGKKSYQEILRRLDKLQNPILFLRNLQRIVWRIDRQKGIKGDETEYSKEVLDTVEYDDDDIIMEHYRLKEPTKSSEIFLFSQHVAITDSDNKESNHLINVGYYYDPINKKLITDNVQNIFCFFPTKETFKTCFVSHAPFLLTDNRQNLKPGENLNKDLVNLLAELAAKAVVYLRDYEVGKDVHLINENITEIIPNYTTNYWEELDSLLEEPIKDAFAELISSERVLLSRNGRYLSQQEAYIGSPRELVDLLSQEQLVQLRKDYYDEDDEDDSLDIESIDFLKWELSQNITKQENDVYEDVNDYSSEDFASDIDSSFMEKQELKWVTKMYTFLRTAAPKLWKITEKDKNRQATSLPFRKATIIKTQKGEWVAPYINGVTPNVYLPLKDDNKSEYNFVAKEYLDNEMARKFFNELDIKEPDEKDYIRQVILGKFKGEHFEVDDDDLKTDFIVLLGYYQRIKDNISLCQEYLSQLRDKLHFCGTDDILHHPNELYFQNDKLKNYFQDDDKCIFIDLNFYSCAVEKFGLHVVREFVSKLGVKTLPLVEQKKKWGTWYLSERLKKQISTSGYSEYHIEDFELEGFDDFCDNETLYRETSLFLWNEVLPAICFSKYEHLTLVYRRKYARSYERAYYTSTFKDALQHNDWLVDVNGNVASANEIALEDLDPEYDRNNGLIQFLGIEKREKSIIELGGTEEQQEQMDLGKRIKNIAGNDLTEEEIIQALADAKAKKKGRTKPVEEAQEEEPQAQNNEPSNKRHEPKDRKPNTDRQKNLQESDTSDTYESEDSYVDESGTDDSGFTREELRQTSTSDMFVNNSRKPKSRTEEQDTTSEEDDVDDVMQKLIEQEEKHNKVKELREMAHSSKKYTKEWFDALIELEYRGGAETEKGATSKSISISFNSVCKEQGSERIYIFNNPSRSIPIWMEEIGDIEVKCSFSNREELNLKFEVANVRDNSLRLKASKAYEVVLNKIEWNRCTKASITLKNQIDLMGKLRTAFNDLDLDLGFNLKENLENNIHFIFGPPGTGKTTTLAKKIISQMETYPTCRILVLAPTNTACDELARKIQEYSEGDCAWLSRFVSTADEELEDIVIDRESMVYEEERCCIISTIARLSFDGFNGMGGNNRLTDIVWDMVICDEASMIPLAEISLAIYTFLNTPILIAGDPMQIKPILHEEEWKDENIYTMVKLDRFDNPQTEPIQFEIENLSTQYRSVPAIGELFSQYAYDGKLKHHRSATEDDLVLSKLTLKPINFIPFKVERYDSIFGIKKLDGSNVHIYSVLFTVELFKFIVREQTTDAQGSFSIGIVCPYSPQAQLIESLIAQIPDLPHNIKVVVGTVHRFQGGQCNLMLVVLNPPLGMKTASDRIFLNNKNILNVAISRAQDHLCVLLPHRDTEGYENLYEINSIGSIAMKHADDVASYTCDQIEEIIFGRKFFIENNTFVTSHQLTNVYTKASKRYEVRIDEKSVDIQLGNQVQRHKDPIEEETQYTDAQEESVMDSEVENSLYLNTADNNNDTIVNDADIKDEIAASRTFDNAEQYYAFFERTGIDIEEAIEILITANTMCAIYVLVQIFGNIYVSQRFGWRTPQESDIKGNKKYCKNSYELFSNIYPELFQAIRQSKLPMKGIGNLIIKDLSLETFSNAYSDHLKRKKSNSQKPKQKSHPVSSYSRISSYEPYRPSQQKTGKLYTDYEYGLSDW